MRKFYKPLSILLAFTMCVSLIAPALAEGELTPPNRDSLAEKTAGTISDAIYNSSTGKEGIESAGEDADKLDSSVKDTVGEVTTKKDEDGNVIGGTTTNTDDIVDKATEAVNGKKGEDGKVDTSNSAQGVIDKAVEEAEEVIDGSVTNDEVKYDEVKNTVTLDEAGNVVVTEEKTEDKTDESAKGKHVDDYVGKVVTNEDGTIDAEKSTGKVQEIAQAAKEAEAAKAQADEAVKDLGSIDVDNITTQAQKDAALAQANAAAEAAKTAADKAQEEADKATNAYNAAQAAYEAALEAYKEATGAENIVGTDEEKKIDNLTDDSTVGDMLNSAEEGAEGKATESKDAALEQLKAAREALEAAEGIKAQADKAQADAEAARLYAENAQNIAAAIQDCLNEKDSNKLSAKWELVKNLQSSMNEQLEGVDRAQVKKDSDRLAAIEGTDGEGGSLQWYKDEAAKAQNIVDNWPSWMPKGPAYKTAAAALNEYNGKIVELEQERAEIRERNGANIDLYRLATLTESTTVVTAILTDDVLKALQKEIDYRSQTAQAAADKAKEATDNYEAAKKAVEQAEKDVKNLSVEGPDVEEARREAEQRLADAKAALIEAEAVKTAAVSAAEAAVKDYKDAVDTAKRINDVVISTGGTTTITTTTGDTGDGGDSGVSIEDQAVPLAGLVTRAEFLDYLWRHEGSPAADAPTFPDVPADHDFAQAIGWGQANRLVVGYPDGNFYPDDTVTVQMVRIILGCFSDVFGTNAVAAADLTTLTGEDGDVVFNCAEVLAEFFGEEYVSAANGEDDIDVDVAA